MDEVVLEVLVREGISGVKITPIMITQPHLIKVEVGHLDLPIGRGMLIGILGASQFEIKEVLLPDNIPTALTELVHPIYETSIPVSYLKEGETGLSRGKYTMAMGHVPDELEEEHPAKQQDIPDGFHPLPIGELDSVTDGFHEIPTEHREMWTEDPERMNRLSYLPIGKQLGLDTFPSELGGGTF